jgi:hypothetical protein
MATKVVMDTQMRGAFGQNVLGFYAAESGLSQGMGEFKTKFLNYGVPSGSDFNSRTSTLGQRTVNYQLTEKSGNPKTITIPAGQLFAGLNSLEYGYTVSSSATNNASADQEATVGAEFLVGNIPLFQFVAFYSGDLEILPGQNMTMRGRIHTNGEMYLNSESAVTLDIVDDQANGINTVQVSAKGDIHRGRKNNTACSGTVNIDKLEDIVAPSNDLDPKTLACVGGVSSLIPVSTLTAWKGSIVSEIASISVPQPDIITKPPQGAGIYWTRAELRIVLVLNKPGQLIDVATGTIGPWLQHSIEVQDSAGVTDAAKTALLQVFMKGPVPATGLYANNAQSSMIGTAGGTRPIYYTDVPNTGYTIAGGVACTCSNTVTACNNTNPSCYPQLNPANTTLLSTTRGIGTRADATPTVNNGGQALNAAQYDRTYVSNNFNNANGGMLADLDYRRGGFYNQREDKWIYLLNVNIADLLQWNRKQPSGQTLFDNADTTDGGLVIYLTVVGPNSGSASNNYGVRIFGSENLWFPTVPGPTTDPTGITTVTDQAIYVQGHFNRGNVAPNPAGNLAKQPASILADSMNVLSTAYFTNAAGTCRNDCQSILALNSGARDAAATWINAGFLSGVDDTTSGNYNGGLENYPRFHESWSGDSLSYWGSFVTLGTPRHVNGIWCGTGTTCNIYDPPTRSYNYDPFFNNVANLPPLSPRFVYVQQVLFTEDFK